MITHDLKQNTPEWHEFRSSHFGASEALAMLGLCPYKTRSQLLHEKATGLVPEVDARTQARFDDGHRFEALAREVAEKIIGEELSPVTISEGKLSASLDGITFSDTVIWEHKSANAELLESLRNKIIPERYQPQIEQQLMLSGAEHCLFSATKWDGNSLVEDAHCWYVSNPELRRRLLQGWTQFAIDLENYQHVEILEKPKADVKIELPALFVHAQGQITDNNMKAYGDALTAKLAEVRAIKLITDQDFSNAKAAASMFREQCKKLMLTKEAMLSQTVSIGEATRMMDAWHEDLRQTALQLEKNVEKEDLAKKTAMIDAARAAFNEHCAASEVEIMPIRLIAQHPDFAGAIKGKRSYATMQDAVDTALANGKIEADYVAKDICKKLAWYRIEVNAEFMNYGILFHDLQQIIFKPMDDFKLLVTTRINIHKQAEATKLETERARIQVEEEAKAMAKIEAERDRIDAERHAIEEAQRKEREIAEAKARAERAAEEANQREILRKDAELEDAYGMLDLFVKRFGHIKEFSSVISAISKVATTERKVA